MGSSLRQVEAKCVYIGFAKPLDVVPDDMAPDDTRISVAIWNT